jgi:hypothetical protein
MAGPPQANVGVSWLQPVAAEAFLVVMKLLEGLSGGLEGCLAGAEAIWHFEQVRTRMRLTGAKAIPVADLVAIRIVELARAGEFDPGKLTETVLAEFDG